MSVGTEYTRCAGRSWMGQVSIAGAWPMRWERSKRCPRSQPYSNSTALTVGPAGQRLVHEVPGVEGLHEAEVVERRGVLLHLANDTLDGRLAVVVAAHAGFGGGVDYGPLRVRVRTRVGIDDAAFAEAGEHAVEGFFERLAAVLLALVLLEELLVARAYGAVDGVVLGRGTAVGLRERRPLLLLVADRVPAFLLAVLLRDDGEGGVGPLLRHRAASSWRG